MLHRPSPDRLNDHNHASVKTVIKLRIGVWEEPGTQSAGKMDSAEEVAEEGQEAVSFHQNICFSPLEGMAR